MLNKFLFFHEKAEAFTAFSVLMDLGFMRLSGCPSLECQAPLYPCCWTCSGKCGRASCQEYCGGHSCIWIVGTLCPVDVAILVFFFNSLCICGHLFGARNNQP